MAENKVYFYIESIVHPGYCLVAGDKYNGQLYLQKHDGRENAQWSFEQNERGGINSETTSSFRIVDKKHGKCIVSGDVANNKLYHQDADSRLNANWTISVGKDKNSDIRGFTFFDELHNFAVAACKELDGHVYHQNFTNATHHPTCGGNVPVQWKCMLWKLVPVQPLTTIAGCPGFFVLNTATTVSNVVMDSAKKSSAPKPDIKLSAPAVNHSPSGQEVTVTVSGSWTTTKSITSSRRISSKIADTISEKGGATFKLGEAVKASFEVQNSTTFENVEETSAADAYVQTKTIAYSATPKTTVAANSTVTVRVTITQQELSVPYSADLVYTLADGSQVTETFSGVWSDVLCVESSISWD
ncbi:MAG: hypothetical protein AB7E32_10155 [Desulfovibrio sp.]